MKKRRVGSFFRKDIEEAKKTVISWVCTDSRGSAALGSYPQEPPEQFVELGIAEQNAISVSAEWLQWAKSFVIYPKVSQHAAAEHVKVDVAYSHNNVKIIGISGGISYGAWAPRPLSAGYRAM